MGGAAVLCIGVFSSIPGLYPHQTSSTPLVVKTKNVSAAAAASHCQMALGGVRGRSPLVYLFF